MRPFCRTIVFFCLFILASSTLYSKSISAPKAIPSEAIHMCAQTNPLLRLADHVLDKRLNLTGFKPRNFGATAAFLKIRYGKMSRDTTMELLDSLAKQSPRSKVRGAEELAFAYLAYIDGLDTAFSYFPKDRVTSPMALGLSSLRQMLLAGFDDQLISKWKKNPKAYDSFINQAAHVLYDQPDTIKLKIADRFEKNGIKIAAFHMLLSMSHHTDLKEFMMRHDNDKKLAKLWQKGVIHDVGLTILHDTGWKLRDNYQSAIMPNHYAVAGSTILETRQSYWVSFTNLIGEYDLSAEISREFIEDVRRGDLDPKRDPASAWISLYHKLIARRGHEQSKKWLLSFSLLGQKTVYEMIQFSIAAKALQPYLSRLEPLSEKRPEGLDNKFDWENWMVLAKQINDGAALSNSPNDHLIVAELLYQAKKFDQLSAYLNAIPPAISLPIAKDLMQRLDRRCMGYVNFPGEAFHLINGPLFRFNN